MGKITYWVGNFGQNWQVGQINLLCGQMPTHAVNLLFTSLPVMKRSIQTPDIIVINW